MASIKFGGGVAAASGKIGGTVYARNRSGAYSRNWSKPTNPNTAKQDFVRAYFGLNSKAWQNLAESTKTIWNSLAAAITRTNRLGETYTPTGRQMFMESSQGLSVLGASPLLLPPLNLDRPAIPGGGELVTAVEALGVLTTLELSGGAAVSGISYVIEATRPFSSNKGNYVNDYRQIKVASTAATVDFLTEYIAIFGDHAIPGNFIATRIYVLDSSNGIGSAKQVLAPAVVSV